jgi:hypothetical protein
MLAAFHRAGRRAVAGDAGDAGKNAGEEREGREPDRGRTDPLDVLHAEDSWLLCWLKIR